MKERPILFSGAMVRAILEDRKTMTRRVVKTQPSIHAKFHHFDVIGQVVFTDGTVVSCPYGVPGMKLWVRETFIDDGETKEQHVYVYRADNENHPRNEGQNWNPSIFMPRAASRILLEITAVRVERLQDVTEEDAMAEGVERDVDPGYWKGYVHPGVFDSAKKSFASLWRSINGPDSWNQNPWVWVIEFKKL